MRRLAASSISSADRCAAPVTTIKEGTTGKCYPSPEYNLLPITWTVHSAKEQTNPLVQVLHKPLAGMTVETRGDTIVRIALNDGSVRHLAGWAVPPRILAIPEVAEREPLVT